MLQAVQFIPKESTVYESGKADNSAAPGTSLFFKALQSISSYFLPAVEENKNDNALYFKKLREKSLKPEKLRTIYDAVAEIEAIERRMQEEKN